MVTWMDHGKEEETWCAGSSSATFMERHWLDKSIALNFSFLISEMGTVIKSLMSDSENQMKWCCGNNENIKHYMDIIYICISKQYSDIEQKHHPGTNLDFLQNR